VIIEHYSATCWLQGLRQRYDLTKTTLNDTPESFTVMLHLPSKNLLAARFCRIRQYGVVICRRGENMPVGYDRRDKGRYLV
jgi:hypothetical protein